MTAQELTDKYDSNLKALQALCIHKNVSGWINYYWAPGHATGQKVRKCNDCWMIVDIKNEWPEMPKIVFSNTVL